MRKTLLACFAVAVAAGCFLDHGPARRGGPAPDVDASIAGVSLADDCAGRSSGACAPPEEGDGLVPPTDGDCAPGGCCDLCTQSGVTLAIAADAEAPLRFRVLSATLLGAGGTELLPLSTSNPELWSESGYGPWDEMVPTPSEIRVHYDLNGVDWSRVEDSYSRTYRVRLEVEIGGVRRTLTSEETTREAPIVT